MGVKFLVSPKGTKKKWWLFGDQFSYIIKKGTYEKK
jgi:hypothetical protein